jgi:hypothetical protein
MCRSMLRTQTGSRHVRHEQLGAERAGMVVRLTGLVYIPTSELPFTLCPASCSFVGCTARAPESSPSRLSAGFHRGWLGAATTKSGCAGGRAVDWFADHLVLQLVDPDSCRLVSVIVWSSSFAGVLA